MLDDILFYSLEIIGTALTIAFLLAVLFSRYHEELESLVDLLREKWGAFIEWVFILSWWGALALTALFSAMFLGTPSWYNPMLCIGAVLIVIFLYVTCESVQSPAWKMRFLVVYLCTFVAAFVFLAMWIGTPAWHSPAYVWGAGATLAALSTLKHLYAKLKTR